MTATRSTSALRGRVVALVPLGSSPKAAGELGDDEAFRRAESPA